MAVNKYTELPYDKFDRIGAAGLSDIELLAVILSSGTRRMNVLELAAAIIYKADPNGRLIGLGRISYEELISIDGIGRVKAIMICCIIEMSKRLSTQFRQYEITLKSPATIAAYYMEQLRHSDVEIVMALYTDSAMNLLKSLILTVGSNNSSIVSSRDVYINALKYKAGFVILIHNHPSGDPSPSSYDIEITRKLIEAGKLIDIPLVDHIIIGDMKYISLKEAGYI